VQHLSVVDLLPTLLSPTEKALVWMLGIKTDTLKRQVTSLKLYQKAIAIICAMTTSTPRFGSEAD
jgi:hypothetical protein